MTYYNWEEILKQKTDKELLKFVKSSNHIDSDAKLKAISELEKRKLDKKVITNLYTELENKWILKKDENNKKSFKENILPYSPYIILLTSPIFLFQFINSGDYSFDNFHLISFLMFILAGIYNIYNSKRELRIIQEERDKENDNISKIVAKIKTHNKC